MLAVRVRPVLSFSRGRRALSFLVVPIAIRSTLLPPPTNRLLLPPNSASAAPAAPLTAVEVRLMVRGVPSLLCAFVLGVALPDSCVPIRQVWRLSLEIRLAGSIVGVLQSR